MKGTLRNAVGNVYKKNENGTFKFENKFWNRNENSSSRIRTNNSPNRLRNNNKSLTSKTNNDDILTFSNSSQYSKSSLFGGISMFFLGMVVLLGITVLVVVMFWDKVIGLIRNTIFKKETQDKDNEIRKLKQELQMNKEEQAMIEAELAEAHEKNDKTNSNDEDDTKVLNSKNEDDKHDKQQKAISKISDEDELKKLYSNDQLVSEDSFCYIGTDDNMRQCIPVYTGDICESGDVYKRLDTCLAPSHFSSTN
jgi:ABC-type multidrug transport system fused ATPase/permease subunit